MNGSSPLTRGKPGRVGAKQSSPGLIPAHAGKTRTRSASARPSPAHPRSRGENGWPARNILPDTGSSPLTRGKRELKGQAFTDTGLIPAHAGKTSRSPSPRPLAEAHPRSRGENHLSASALSSAKGSSPLTRGKLMLTLCTSIGTRLIPAHAGKTFTTRFAPSLARAHPRSRGENAKATRLFRPGSGSSPLTRGKLMTRLRLSP